MKTMPKGSVPMRIRRRQSDAKWRASVAICYDTLKHIIPNNEKMSKRKISKALILQETKKHIRDLENHLQELLQIRAPLKGKAVLCHTEDGSLTDASLNTVRHDFADKQQLFYVFNCNQQRKRSNIPSDTEIGLVNLREKKCPLHVISLRKLDDFCLLDGDKYVQKEKPKAVKSWTVQDGKISEKRQSNKHILKILAEQEELEQATARICPSQDEQYVPGSGVTLKKEDEERSLYDLTLMPEVTPTKSDIRTDSTSTPRSNVDLYFNSDPSMNGEVTYILPSDLAISPIKLPELEDDDSNQTAPLSPATLLALQQAECGEYEIDIEDLLCSESIEHMNLEGEDAEVVNTRTPSSHSIQVKQRGHKRDSINRGRSLSADRKSASQMHQPKCRRKLESSQVPAFLDSMQAPAFGTSTSVPVIGASPSIFQEDVKTTAQRTEENPRKNMGSYSSKGESLLAGELLGESGKNSVQIHGVMTGHKYLYQSYEKGKDYILPTGAKIEGIIAFRSQQKNDNTKSSRKESFTKGHSGRSIQIDDLLTDFNLKSDQPVPAEKPKEEDGVIFSNDIVFAVHENSKNYSDNPDARIVPEMQGYDSFDKDFCPFDLNSTDEVGFYTLSNGTSSQSSDQLTCSDGGSFSTLSSQLGLETTSSSALSSQVVPEFECIPIDTEYIMI